MRKRTALAAGVATAAALGGVFTTAFTSEMRKQEARVRGRSEHIPTQFGTLEYAQRGSGPPLLMIHGTGGGFDQGLTFTEGLHGFRVIAPSRFGYLGSDFPADPSSEHQADAFIALLDHLHIRKLVVAGGSAGALSAAQFALRHPDRTSALVLVVPAANVSGRDPAQMSPAMEYVVRQLATSDFLFWSGKKFARNSMIATLLATDPQLVAQASASEQARANRILDEIMPVSLRSRGMLNDAKLAGNPALMDFSKISVPTLVISVEDDGFGTATTAREIASAVPGAKLVIYPTGGHIWVGNDAALWREVNGFVRPDRPSAPRNASMRNNDWNGANSTSDRVSTSSQGWLNSGNVGDYSPKG